MNSIPHLRTKLAVTGGMLAYVALIYWLPITCPILFVTGIPCPGCGLTRAWLAALRLDFAAAFAYHPMFWAIPILYLCLWRDGRLFSSPRMNRMLYLVIVLGFWAAWAMRLWGAFC